jgi:hypothetical protein
MRINTYDLLQDIAKKNGVAINKVLIEDIGKVVNGATARADIGQGRTASLFLWAPRMMLSNVQVLTAHYGGMGLKTSFARKQARNNLAKITTSIATVAAVLNALDPESVETDPRSTDFLKYRNGDTRIDLTGGMGSYITLTSRIMCGLSGIPAVKNSQTKIMKELNTGAWKDGTVLDVGLDFLFNKTTPLVRQGTYIAKGKNFEGKKPTVLSAIADLTLPIPVKNFYQNIAGDYPEKEFMAVLGNFLDLVGINANTYQNLDQWDNKGSDRYDKAKKKFGEEKLTQKNINYNVIVNQKIDDLVKTSRYIKLSDEEKEKKIQQLKAKEKSKLIGD